MKLPFKVNRPQAYTRSDRSGWLCLVTAVMALVFLCAGCTGNYGEAAILASPTPSAAATPTPTPAPTPTPTPAPTPTSTPAPTPTSTPTPSPTPTPTPEPPTFAELVPVSTMTVQELVGDNGDRTEDFNYPPPDTYLLEVDVTNQVVTAYEKDETGAYTKPVRMMVCTSGGKGNSTPAGTFEMGGHRVRFGFFYKFDCYAQYWSQITRSIYFHSVLYSQRSAKSLIRSSYNNLGKRTSHGCVRLLVPDAQWIYENIAPGTTCVVTKKQKDKDLQAAMKPQDYKTGERENAPAPDAVFGPAPSVEPEE